jgi:hypothetical protein
MASVIKTGRIPPPKIHSCIIQGLQPNQAVGASSAQFAEKFKIKSEARQRRQRNVKRRRARERRCTGWTKQQTRHASVFAAACRLSCHHLLASRGWLRCIGARSHWCRGFRSLATHEVVRCHGSGQKPLQQRDEDEQRHSDDRRNKKDYGVNSCRDLDGDLQRSHFPKVLLRCWLWILHPSWRAPARRVHTTSRPNVTGRIHFPRKPPTLRIQQVVPASQFRSARV